MSKKKLDVAAPTHSALKQRMREVLMIAGAALGLVLLLSLLSYHAADWLNLSGPIVANMMGKFGAVCAEGLFSLLGFSAYLMPVLLVYGAWLVYIEHQSEASRSRLLTCLRWFGAFLAFVAGSGLSSLLFISWQNNLPYGPGGVMGANVSKAVLPLLNETGSVLSLIAVFLVGLTLFSGVTWLRGLLTLLRLILRGFYAVFKAICYKVESHLQDWRLCRQQKKLDQAVIKFEPAMDINMAQAELDPFDYDPEPIAAKPKLAIIDRVKPVAKPEPIPQPEKIKKPTKPLSHGVPSIELLDAQEAPSSKVSKESLMTMAQLVEQKLSDFGISAKVVGACPGPVVTRFELDLAPGIKVARLTTLSKDLARSLSAKSVRIVEVIPGKTVVGLELPNEVREIVRLRSVLDSEAFRKNTSPLSMALGKDISGEPEVVDLQKMPHLLVAGTTGSGKSVGLNAMLLSMLLRATPEELRMIMIDPKMLELSIYEGVPHLLTPVVTDMKEAANALRWCVKEMDRRYRLMAAVGVRNLAGYNDTVKAAIAAGKPLKDPIWKKLHPGMDETCPELQTMPYIVVLVDEFADMIMVVGKKVEELITRLAQKARAAGIHLILATQRPSVDVITGLIKANIPTRIAFQVSSRIDSRTILDQQGAEQLLGHGDMLYLPPGSGVPIRVHGAYVADHEVHKVVQAWKELGTPDYIETILKTEALEGEEGASEAGGGEDDPLYDEAVNVVLESKRASISGVQRRLKIGYNRAARLLEQMEAAGLLSEIQANGMREILVSNND
ncbi:MAG: DNA translocase FtsK 4TM domain-containing protein [Gammaproteobacteria bacterium]|nr:DNA translocase FtsK 4TM domain-containing protein [Gammaproteobacteria bacterium]